MQVENRFGNVIIDIAPDEISHRKKVFAIDMRYAYHLPCKAFRLVSLMVMLSGVAKVT